MTLLLITALSVIVIQHKRHASDEKVAEQLSTRAKAFELELAKLESQLANQPATQAPDALTRANEQRQSTEQRYATLADERKLIGVHRSKQDLLIFRVARIFGEYDLNVPDNFVAEVKRYIHEWQRSDRLTKAVARFNESGQAKTVVDALRILSPTF